jgi:hypothetical protein
VAETLWRLAWALPLVLVLGAAAAWAVGRLGGAGASHAEAARLRHVESLSVSEGLRVHLLELDRRPLVVVESALHAVQLDVAGLEAVRPRAPERSASARLRRLFGKAAP